MILNVICVRPDAAPGRVNGQRNVVAYPAEPAATVSTQKVMETLAAEGAYMATLLATAKVADSMAAAPMFPAQVFATAKSVATLPSQGIYLQ